MKAAHPLASILGLCLCAAATAQQADESKEEAGKKTKLEEILVIATATKTDASLMEVPQSVSLVTREEMDARNVRDIGEAVSYTAGAYVGSTGETKVFGGNSIQLRGFGGAGTAGMSANEYLDGLKLAGTSYAGANLDPYLLERVEVLRGPASVLYGQNQPGGVVNMVSKLSGPDRGGELRFGATSRSGFDGAFDAGGALGEHVFFRLVGIALQEDLQADYTSRERRAIAPSLSWFGENTSLTVLTNYQADDVNGTVLNALPAAALFSNPNGQLPADIRVGEPSFERWDRETWSAGYLFSHSFSDTLAFENKLRYTHNSLDSRWIFRGSLLSDMRTLTRSAWVANEDASDLTVDSRMVWKVETGAVRHTLLAGFDYLRLSNDTFRRFGGEGVPSLDLFDPVYFQSIPMPAVWQSTDFSDVRRGIYLQDQIEIGELSLLVGGRYDESTSTIRDRLNPATTTQRDHAFTSRLGAIYNFDNGLAPYLSYAESFEPVGGTTFEGTPFVPLEGRQYEIGLKYQPSGTPHLVSLAVFDLTLNNVVTGDPNPDHQAVGFFSVQTGEIRTRGLELEGKTGFETFGGQVDLSAAYTYLDDEVTRSNGADLGKHRPQIPTHSGSLWANYSVRDGALAGLELGLGLRRTGATAGDPTNVFSVPAFTLVDMALHYDLSGIPNLSGWKLGLNVTNLLDEYYVASCLAGHTCYIGLSRDVRATVSYDW